MLAGLASRAISRPHAAVDVRVGWTIEAGDSQSSLRIRHLIIGRRRFKSGRREKAALPEWASLGCPPIPCMRRLSLMD